MQRVEHQVGTEEILETKDKYLYLNTTYPVDFLGFVKTFAVLEYDFF